MMRFWAMIGALCAALLAGSPAAAQLVRWSGDWLLVCDNRTVCTITGAPPPERQPNYPRVLVRITREDVPQYPMLMSTFVADAAGNAHPQLTTLDHLSLSVGPSSAPVAALRVDPQLSGTANTDYYFNSDVPELLRAIAMDRPAYVRHGFGAMAAMPVGDLGALLRQMDRIQQQVPLPRSDEDPTRRERFLYELFPREQVDEPIRHPVFERACAGTDYSHARGYQLDHVNEGVGTLLVLLSCGGRDYIYTWYPTGNSAPQPLVIERDRDARFSAMSASFNAEEGTLTIIDHPPGRDDCGVRTYWGWVDGEGMVLLTRQIMPRCRYIRPEHWPVAFMLQDWTIR